jgi:hypothetical protein
VADVKKLLAVHKRRVPDEQVGLYLHALGFVRALLPKANSAQSLALGEELKKAARLYIRGRGVEARKKAKVGQPQHMADIAFIYAMARLWESVWGRPKFRKYRQPRKGERPGRQRGPDRFPGRM